MFKNYIIREKIYSDEIHSENIFRPQKCIILEKERRAGPIHELSKIKRGRGGYEIGEEIAEEIIVKDLYYFIAYVQTDEKALEIAARWIEEEKLQNNIYKIKWVDQHYSIFD